MYGILRRGFMALATLFAAAVATNALAADSFFRPGGELQAFYPDQRPRGVCPLKHTDVVTEISGYIARITLTQRFTNPYSDPIEAVYTFPMSERAAVDTMTMTIGDRVIRGAIKEREEAQRIYQQAKNAGKTASLLDQERPNIFTQSVANILPGNDVVITISYVEYLKYEDGQYEFSFPMVVGPRYIPGSQVPAPPDALHSDVNTGLKPGPASTTQVPDASRVTPPVTPPGTRAGHDISMEVRIDAGIPLREVKSDQHEIDVTTSGSTSIVRLKDKNEIPNRDFILHYSVAADAIADAVLTHADAKGGFFTLILQPPARVRPENITPKEMIFVIDKSGSMSGFPIEKAKETMRMCVESMNPDDTFNLVSFSGGLGYCFERPMPNTPSNRQKALDYLKKLEGGGGTEMMPAIRAALSGQDDPKRLRIVCFMTDGFIGNDMEILDCIQKNANSARVFSFGIGTSVNRFLIEGMARAGRGAAEVVPLEGIADEASKRFHDRVQNPVLTDVSVDFGGLDIHDTYPQVGAIPDLFSAKPVVITGRYDKPGRGRVTIHGTTANGPFTRTVDVDLPGNETAHDVLAPLWARERIEYLMEQDWKGIQLGNGNRDVKGSITALGLEFGLVTQFTSFVAVEERVVTEGGRTKTVQVPVEMPDGVSYDGVFGKEVQTMPAEKASASFYNYSTQLGSASARRESRASLGIPLAQALPAPSPAPPVAYPEGSADYESKDKLHEQHQLRLLPEPNRPSVAVSPKLDTALQGLAAKVVNGSYESGNVKVKAGWVAVFVHVKDLSADTLDSLKKLNVRIIAQKAAGKLVHLEVKVEDLDKLAALPEVTKVEPPTF